MGVANRVCILPKQQTPVFPERCASCEAPNPQGTVPLGGDGLSFSVPICENCFGKTRSRNAIQKGLFWAGMIASIIATVLIIFLVGGMAKIVAVLFVVIFLAPWVIYGWIAPVPLMVVRGEGIVQFEFQHETYAADFAAMNGTKTGFLK
jgi:hypothetical protein